MITRSAMPAVTAAPCAIGDDARRARVGAAPHERLAMLAIADGDAAPAVIERSTLTRASFGLRSMKWRPSTHPERLRLADAVACRQRIDGILHRVGRQHVAIVAVRIGCVVAAFEGDGHGEVAEIVTVAVARHAAPGGCATFRTTCRQRRVAWMRA